MCKYIDEIDRLSKLAARIPTRSYNLSFYREYSRDYRISPIHERIANILSEYLVFECEFNYPRCAALLDCDPSYFSINDIKLAVRGLWKSGRVGFYWNGNQLYKNGWVSKLLKQLNNPCAEDALVPEYPYPPTKNFNAEKLWGSFKGYMPVII